MVMPRSPLFRLYAPLALMLLLASCATRPPLTDAELDREWRQHSERLVQLSHWEARGRIAVRMDEEGWTAGLHWRQEPSSWHIRLLAPLGRGRYDLRGNAAGVQLRTPDDQLLMAGDARTLLQDNLGWQIPVSGLAYWVRGLPAPGGTPEQRQLDEHGRLRELQQDGWHIQYERYGLYSGSLDLPEKLTIERPGLRLRLLIHTWKL